HRTKRSRRHAGLLPAPLPTRWRACSERPARARASISSGASHMPSRAPRPDPIRVIEAAYAGEADDARWLDEIICAASPYGIGGGVIAFTVRVDRRAEVELMRRSDSASVRDALELRRISDTLPAPIARETYAPTEFVGNATYRLARLALKTGVSLDEMTRGGSARLPQTW